MGERGEKSKHNASNYCVNVNNKVSKQTLNMQPTIHIVLVLFFILSFFFVYYFFGKIKLFIKQ